MRCTAGWIIRGFRTRQEEVFGRNGPIRWTKCVNVGYLPMRPAHVPKVNL